MARRGFERDEMRSRAQQRGWEADDRFRQRYGARMGGGARRREDAEENYEQASDFDPMRFEDFDDESSGRGFQRDMPRGERGTFGGGFAPGGQFGRGGQVGRGGQFGRAGQYGGMSGQRGWGRDEEYGAQGYRDEEGWFRGQGMGMFDEDEDERFGRYGEGQRRYGFGEDGRHGWHSRQGERGFGAAQFERGLGGTGSRDYAHGGFRGHGQFSGQGGLGRGGQRSEGYDDFGGPHFGRGPEGYRRSDDRIREEICDLLTQHSYIDASGIRVEVSQCEVVLSGTVHSRDEKRLAEDLAESAQGASDVRNDLRVQSQARGNDMLSRHAIGTPHGSAESHAGDAEKHEQGTAGQQGAGTQHGMK